MSFSKPLCIFLIAPLHETPLHVDNYVERKLEKVMIMELID